MPADLRDAVLFLAPGFIALRIFNTYGRVHRASDWHWGVWSAIASVPLDLVSRGLLANVRLFDIDPELAEGATRLAVAIAAGALASVVWYLIRFSKVRGVARLIRNLSDSVWDQKLEEAHRRQRPVELETTDGATYFGWCEAAREETEAEPWVHMTRVSRRAAGRGKEERDPRVTGVLIHRDQIRRMTIFESDDEAARRKGAEG